MSAQGRKIREGYYKTEGKKLFQVFNLALYPNKFKTYGHTKICTRMFIASKIIDAKHGSNHKVLQWVNR